MSIPSHNSSCITKAFPTNCPDCKADVYFFGCTCGSKVYFDELGFPWSQHYCQARRLREQLEIMVGVERMTDDELYTIILKYEKDHNVKINDDMMMVIENVIGKRKYTFEKIQILPDLSIKDISGQIMEFNREVNLLKKFGYDLNSDLSIKMLGKLSKEVFGEIRVRENPNNKNVSREFSISQ